MGAVHLPPFRTGPSHIGRYFFHDCDRFLRYSATRSDQCKGQGVPKVAFDTSPIMRAILAHGYACEEQVVNMLGKAVSIAADPGGALALHERQFTWEETLELRCLRRRSPPEIEHEPVHPPCRMCRYHA